MLQNDPPCPARKSVVLVLALSLLQATNALFGKHLENLNPLSRRHAIPADTDCPGPFHIAEELSQREEDNVHGKHDDRAEYRQVCPTLSGCTEGKE